MQDALEAAEVCGSSLDAAAVPSVEEAGGMQMNEVRGGIGEMTRGV
jgi:hypothetical protein